MKTRKRSMAILIFCSAILILLDQITKYAAAGFLKGTHGISVIPGVFELSYLENRGSAFGMLQGQRVFFILMAVLVLSGIPYIYSRIPLSRRFFYMRAVAILFFAGAAGNTIDRILYGYVRDFLYFSLIDFPVFNVADIYVTVGTVSMAALILFYYKDEDFEQIHH